MAKAVAVMVVDYALSPSDLIPVLGYLDHHCKDYCQENIISCLKESD